MTITADDIKKLREETGAGVMDAKKALEENDGDHKKAADSLRATGVEKAEKRSERVTGQGLIETYIHNGRVGAMVELNCETDFVARTDEFKNLAKEISMQIASMNPVDVEELMAQDYIRDSSKKIKDLVTETVAKTGENVQVKRFVRFTLGE
jgi:elongation factor Ts